MNYKTIITINKVELKREIARRSRSETRKALERMRARFKVSDLYSGREVKAQFNFMILNLP
jgi:hypothetical protein